MQRHTPLAQAQEHAEPTSYGVPVLTPAPRWATIRRAVEVAAGKRRSSSIYPFERFTVSAQNLLKTAQAEARGAGYIGTEHLLLAVFADPSSHGGMVLASLGVFEPAVRGTLERVLARHKPAAAERIVPTSRVKKVIELAFKLCGAGGDPRVTTGHILLAMAIEKEGIGAHVMSDLGATAERIESALEGLTEPEA
jgi:ATP-dependent Clp protease ATP-binding subunit ClpA